MKKTLLSLLLFFSTSSYAQGSYALYDYERQEYQVSENTDQVRPIASITKLFTAIVVLRSGAELDEKVRVNGLSNGRFPNGSMVTRRDLLKATLISSDNRSAETLAKTYPGGFVKFILDADEYIKGRGLMNTHIDDATGLSATNVSTAEDLIRFLSSISANEIIRSIASERSDIVMVPKGKKTIKINLHNTNPSVFAFDNILISKTGFTNPAGRCVLMLIEKQGRQYAVVILGQKNVVARSKIASELITAQPLPLVTRPPVTPELIEFNFAL